MFPDGGQAPRGVVQEVGGVVDGWQQWVAVDEDLDVELLLSEEANRYLVQPGCLGGDGHLRRKWRCVRSSGAM